MTIEELVDAMLDEAVLNAEFWKDSWEAGEIESEAMYEAAFGVLACWAEMKRVDPDVLPEDQKHVLASLKEAIELDTQLIVSRALEALDPIGWIDEVMKNTGDYIPLLRDLDQAELVMCSLLEFVPHTDLELVGLRCREMNRARAFFLRNLEAFSECIPFARHMLRSCRARVECPGVAATREKFQILIARNIRPYISTEDLLPWLLRVQKERSEVDEQDLARGWGLPTLEAAAACLQGSPRRDDS